jgi:hypothetical protein
MMHYTGNITHQSENMFLSPATSSAAGHEPGLLRRALRAVAAAAAAVRRVSRRAERPRGRAKPKPTGLRWARLDGFARLLLYGTALPAWTLEEALPPVTAEVLAMAAAFEIEVLCHQLSLRDPGRHHLALRERLRHRFARPVRTRALPRLTPAPRSERGLPPPLASPLLI